LASRTAAPPRCVDRAADEYGMPFESATGRLMRVGFELGPRDDLELAVATFGALGAAPWRRLAFAERRARDVAAQRSRTVR
jgi:hypothetical protein